MTIDTAIIMAAGLGSRIPGFSRSAPKGFIPIAGKPIVERSLELLASRGIRRVVIGTGHLADAYEALARRFSTLQVECVRNPDYAASGSLETLLRCAAGLDGDFLSLESDLLYDAAMLDRVLASPFPDVMLASGRTDSGDEVYLQTDGESKLVNLSKNASALGRIDAELVGICKLRAQTPGIIATWLSASGQGRPAQIHYEEGLLGIAPTTPIHVEVADLPWTEIDTPAHLARAEALIWPRISPSRGNAA